MGMQFEANMDGFMDYVLQHFPKAEIGEDNDGQLIIYTNLHQDTTGQIVEMDDA